jgi:nucleotide-binding universal stress UspA family protein
LIVVGRRRHAGRVTFAGGVPGSLVHGARCAVAVAPRGISDDSSLAPRVITVAYDGSAEAQVALATAETLALTAGATIRLVGVHDPSIAHVASAGSGLGSVACEAGSTPGALHDELERAAETLDHRTRPLVILETGDPAQRIASRAESGDLLVVGSRGHGPLLRVALGSVSTELLDSAPCPVLIVPRHGYGFPAVDLRCGTAVHEHLATETARNRKQSVRR